MDHFMTYQSQRIFFLGTILSQTGKKLISQKRGQIFRLLFGKQPKFGKIDDVKKWT